MICKFFVLQVLFGECGRCVALSLSFFAGAAATTTTTTTATTTTTTTTTTTGLPSWPQSPQQVASSADLEDGTLGISHSGPRAHACVYS